MARMCWFMEPEVEIFPRSEVGNDLKDRRLKGKERGRGERAVSPVKC